MSICNQGSHYLLNKIIGTTHTSVHISETGIKQLVMDMIVLIEIVIVYVGTTVKLQFLSISVQIYIAVKKYLPPSFGLLVLHVSQSKTFQQTHLNIRL